MAAWEDVLVLLVVRGYLLIIFFSLPLFLCVSCCLIGGVADRTFKSYV